VLVTELSQRFVEPLHFFESSLIERRVVGARQPGQAVTGQRALLDRVQAAAGESALFIDKQVVHDPAQPGAGFVDLDQIVELAECLDQQFLEQVFRLSFAAGQAPRQAKQAIEVRPDQALESKIMFSAAHNKVEFIARWCRSKDPIGRFTHLKAMKTNYTPAIMGVIVAIAITASMDATGFAAFSALPLFPLTALYWYLQRFSRAEMGLMLGRLRDYRLALLYPLLVLGLAGLIALIGAAVDTSEADWNKTFINIGLMSSVGILMGLITEEGFFRGWLWAALKRAGQSDLQVLIWTSLAFTAWHISAIGLDTGFDVPGNEIPIYLVNATLLGVIWGMLRLLSGSVVVPSVCHAVWNGIDYPLFGFGEKVGALGIEQTHIYGPEVGVVGIILNLMFVAVMLLVLKARREARS